MGAEPFRPFPVRRSVTPDGSAYGLVEGHRRLVEILRKWIHLEKANFPARWLRIDTGEKDGRFNMDFDLRLVENFRVNKIPTLRFYRWKPYCISLGRNQNENDVAVERAAADGIDVVTRPTGGKAVLHADELTYSVVMDSRGLSVLESYNLISAALAEGIRMLGAEAALAESSADFRKLFKDPASVPCFTTSAIYEVEYRGRKLIGSAQRRFGDVLLQHGSILLGGFHKKIVDYVKGDSSAIDEMKKNLDEHTITLNEILSRNVEAPEVARAITKGFEAALGAAFSSVNEA